MTMTIENHVLQDGEGTPLILVNAYPVDGRMWGACADEIRRQSRKAGMEPFPIWAPDMPGSGMSPVPTPEESGPQNPDGSYPEALDRMADAYADLLREAGHDRAVWAGLSMGGYLVADLWRRHPESVAGLALCDTMACSDGTGGEARLAMADACESSGSVEPVMHFARPSDGDSTVKRSQAFVDTMTEWIMGQSPAGLAWRQRMTYGRPDLSAVPGTIDVPTAVVSGELDPSSNPSVMKPLADSIQGAMFASIPDCGNFSAVEHPDVVATQLVGLPRRIAA